MPWIGPKRLALVPLSRTNALPPDQIPADWEDQIMRRMLFDPAIGTGADRSLRAYIHAVSSGRADLDAVVMPRMTAAQQDVPVGFLEGQDRKSTRLNSSHLVISYAVFCLKKKIK